MTRTDADATGDQLDYELVTHGHDTAADRTDEHDPAVDKPGQCQADIGYERVIRGDSPE